MGLIARTARIITKAAPTTFQPVATWQDQRAQLPNLNYLTLAREGYSRNELVFGCIEEIATSAAEPEVIGKLNKASVYEHPLLDLMRNPNPYLTSFEFWATVIMYRYISGNAYALKVRSAAGKTVEMWLLRPDRVRIVADRQKYISHYEYWIGSSEAIPIPAEDVIHFKTRHPYDDFYGMSPLLPAAGRIDLDNYTRDFVKSFFVNAGVPSGMLSIKQKLTDDARDEVRRRFRDNFGGPAGWHDLLVLDNAEATFTPLTAQLGPRGLVVPELDEINEARIAMVFHVPLSLLGARLGMASSSYGNRKSDRESFWDETLSPLYRELMGPVNLNLTPEFSGIDSLEFDLSGVRALQEDEDKVHERWRNDYQAGLVPLETAQDKIHLEQGDRNGTYLVPLNMQPMTSDQLQEIASSAAAQVAPAPAPAPALLPAGPSDA